jgi:hypothetical protein
VSITRTRSERLHCYYNPANQRAAWTPYGFAFFFPPFSFLFGCIPSYSPTLDFPRPQSSCCQISPLQKAGTPLRRPLGHPCQTSGGEDPSLLSRLGLHFGSSGSHRPIKYLVSSPVKLIIGHCTEHCTGTLLSAMTYLGNG